MLFYPVNVPGVRVIWKSDKIVWNRFRVICIRQCALQQYLGQYWLWQQRWGSCLWGNSSYSAQRWHSLLCLPADLVDATTKTVNVWGATYYLPSAYRQCRWTAQRVTITQREGADDIRFSNTRAFVGTRNRKGERLILKWLRREKKTVSVTFDRRWLRAKRSSGLRPVRNPRFSGVYLFGVTAYPVGEKSHGQFLGWTTSLLRRW